MNSALTLVLFLEAITILLLKIENTMMKKDISNIERMIVGLNIILHKKLGITTHELAETVCEYQAKDIDITE